MDRLHFGEHPLGDGLDGRALRIRRLEHVQHLVEPVLHERLVLFGRAPAAKSRDGPNPSSSDRLRVREVRRMPAPSATGTAKSSQKCRFLPCFVFIDSVEFIVTSLRRWFACSVCPQDATRLLRAYCAKVKLSKVGGDRSCS
jgi:hypothetical protein